MTVSNIRWIVMMVGLVESIFFYLRDLLQLPPVHENPAFVHLADEKVHKYLGSLSAINLWSTLFDYDELTINMRQQEDSTYRELLSRIRIGLVTKSDCDILEKRKISLKGESFETRLNELCDLLIICHLTPFIYCLLVICVTFLIL